MTTRRGSKLHPDEAAKFAAWLGGRANDDVDSEPAVAAAETPVAPIPAPAPEKPKDKFIVRCHNAYISGTADDLLLYIGAMLGGRTANVHISIEFKEENEA